MKSTIGCTIVFWDAMAQCSACGSRDMDPTLVAAILCNHSLPDFVPCVLILFRNRGMKSTIRCAIVFWDVTAHCFACGSRDMDPFSWGPCKVPIVKPGAWRIARVRNITCCYRDTHVQSNADCRGKESTDDDDKAVHSLWKAGGSFWRGNARSLDSTMTRDKANLLVAFGTLYYKVGL
jgi:hypothetical protein